MLSLTKLQQAHHTSAVNLDFSIPDDDAEEASEENDGNEDAAGEKE